jgi:hypothetical protein
VNPYDPTGTAPFAGRVLRPPGPSSVDSGRVFVPAGDPAGRFVGAAEPRGRLRRTFRGGWPVPAGGAPSVHHPKGTPMANPGQRSSRVRLPRLIARLAAAAGLGVNAAVHADLADQYDAISATFSQGDLFRIEAALASLAAVLVLLWRRPLGDAFAWLVAAGGLFAIILYRYVDVGAHGPLPDMYEPVWTSDKKVSAIAQIVTIVATAFLLLTHRRGRPPRVT